MAPDLPDHAAILDALRLLGAPDDAVAAFPSHPDNPAFSFAEAVADAPAAIETDWRFHPAEALNEVWQRIYPHGVKGMIDEADEETGFPKKIILQHAGVGARYRVRIKNAECLHDLFFALEKVLPADLQILSLLPLEATDTYLHIIQPAPVFAQVRELLGPWFWQVFAVHASPLTFTKTGGDVKPKRNLIKNYLKHTKEWLATQESYHRQARENIEKNLTCTNMADLAPAFVGTTAQQRKAMVAKFLERWKLPQRFRLMRTDLERLGLRKLQEAAVAVLDGDQAGWRHIHLAMQYEVLSLHLARGVGGNMVIDDVPDDGGRLLGLAWTLGDMGVVRWLSEDMIRFPHNFTGWKYTPLEPMLLQLYGLWKNIDINWQRYPKAKLGVYRQLFDSWNDPARLPGVLDMLCDYHLLRTGESGFQEFYNDPYNIFPVEILAVHRLRGMQGLETPTIAHPLMDSPLAKLPLPVQAPRDELLEKIIAAATAETPNLTEELKQSQ